MAATTAIGNARKAHCFIAGNEMIPRLGNQKILPDSGTEDCLFLPFSKPRRTLDSISWFRAGVGGGSGE